MRLSRVAKILSKFYRAISMFVVIVDGILLSYLAASNLLDVMSGRYGPSTYTTVVVTIILGIILSAFYLGALVEKRREPRKQRRLGRSLKS